MTDFSFPNNVEVIPVNFALAYSALARRVAAADAYLLHNDTDNARRQIEMGVTTIRDLGARDWVDIALRDAIQKGWQVGPRMLAAGHGITTTGGRIASGVPKVCTSARLRNSPAIVSTRTFRPTRFGSTSAPYRNGVTLPTAMVTVCDHTVVPAPSTSRTRTLLVSAPSIRLNSRIEATRMSVPRSASQNCPIPAAAERYTGEPAAPSAP
jgi:hypothetical protein